MDETSSDQVQKSLGSDQLHVEQPAASEDNPYFKNLSPHARSLMKMMGADPRSLTLTAAQIQRWGLDRPESVLNLIRDDELVRRAAQLPSVLLAMSDSELEARMDGRPTRQDRRMRLYFWEEYEQAAKLTQAVDLESLSKEVGILNWTAYRQNLVDNSDLLAWFLSPPASYRLQMREALDLGLKRLMDILELPIQDPKTGKVNAGVGLLVLQAYKLVDSRVNGAVAQKLIQLKADAGQVPEGGKFDEAAVERRLKELEQLMSPSAPTPETQAQIQKQIAEKAQSYIESYAKPVHDETD